MVTLYSVRMSNIMKVTITRLLSIFLVGEDFIPDGCNFCRVDVYHSEFPLNKRVIAMANVNSNASVQEGVMRVTLPFSIELPGTLQFRLHSLGNP